MPRIEVHGIYELAIELAKMGTSADAVADEMLKAGANEMVDAWQQAIKELGLIELGDMIGSIAPKKKTEYYGGIKSITVNPQGYDSKGQPNAYKAWALNRGVPSKKIGAYHHLELAQEKADLTVAPAMQKVLSQYISTGKIPEIVLKQDSSRSKAIKGAKKNRKKASADAHKLHYDYIHDMNG